MDVEFTNSKNIKEITDETRNKMEEKDLHDHGKYLSLPKQHCLNEYVTNTIPDCE